VKGPPIEDSHPRGNLKKQPTVSSVAEFYHELTKYSPEKLSAGIQDPLEKPPAFKEYLSERKVDLKPFLKSPSAFPSRPPRGGVGEHPHGASPPSPPRQGAVPPRSPGGDARGGGILRSLSRLLYHTGGITEILKGRDGASYFRAAPSAGALYPTEVYLATRKVEGLTDSIHSYSVREHSLAPIWEGNFGNELWEYCFRHKSALNAQMFLILTGVFRRSAWRYGDRAYRRILLDTGHLLGNAVAYAPEEGLSVVGIGGFYDAAVSDLLFLDPDEEAVLLIAPIVQQKELEGVRFSPVFPLPSGRSTPPAAVGESGLMRLLHERSGIRYGNTPRPPRDPVAHRLQGAALRLPGASLRGKGEAALAPSIGPVIRRRRSSRSFVKGTVKLPVVAEILRWAYQPVRPYLGESLTLEKCVFLDPTMIETYLVATRVEGLTPGVYRLDVERQALVSLKKGEFQNELWNLCLGQELARDAALGIIHTANLPACVERYGDRAYRYLHLDAGHLGQRINLAAVSRDVGVSGIGGFFDEEVNALLNLPEHISTLYITLLGQPATKGSPA
jgi:SagB-type dehydrogenase family enzyme